MSDGMLFVGQDGCIRDLAELRGTYKVISQTRIAIQILRDALMELGVAGVGFFLDEPVSNSGRLKSKIYETGWQIPTTVQIVRNPDAVLKKMSYVITGDSIILDECESWFNLTAYCIEKCERLKGLSRLINLGVYEQNRRAIQIECDRVCKSVL